MSILDAVLLTYRPIDERDTATHPKPQKSRIEAQFAQSSFGTRVYYHCPNCGRGWLRGGRGRDGSSAATCCSGDLGAGNQQAIP